MVHETVSILILLFHICDEMVIVGEITQNLQCQIHIKHLIKNLVYSAIPRDIVWKGSYVCYKHVLEVAKS